jgi:transaldolase
MTVETPTEFWNDSCEVRSLERAIASGATGATSNPVIVMAAIDADRPEWDEVTRRLIAAHPSDTEIDIAWKLVDEAARRGAALLLPVFERLGGRGGRLSVQTNPVLYRSAERMVAEGEHFATLAPNIAVKIPAVEAGMVAIEELTAHGIVTNATVSYSVSQAVAAAEAVERGLDRLAPGVDPERVTPWVTIMVGRIDDHLRDLVDAGGTGVTREHVRHASTAIVRRAYRIFRERGYRAKLLAAAMRSHHHWSEFIGGELVVTIPPDWQEKFDASGVEIRSRIDDPVDAAIVEELRRLPDFVRAYDERAMAPGDFASFGASVKTLRQFIGGYEKLLHYVRDAMLPPP